MKLWATRGPCRRSRRGQAALRDLAFTLAVFAGLAGPAAAQTGVASCPPVIAPPSAERLQEAQATAFDRGFLWRLSKGGHSSYLYGTIHVGKPEWILPGPTIRQALGEAQVLALELDMTNPSTLQRLQAAFASTPSDAAVAPVLQERLAQEAARACLPPGALKDQRPTVQALTLVVLAARWEGLDAAYSQEAMLGGYATSRALPIIALETVDEQTSALLPASTPETERFIESALDQIRSGATRRATRRLAQVWADGELEQLASYEQWCECVTSEDDRTLLRRLNDDRNPALASRIGRLHREGKPVFVGVGALHMTGPKALPQLLRRRGFKVERVDLRH